MRSIEPSTIRKITVHDHGCHYETFLVEGYLNGCRVRRKFQRHEEAIGEKAKLDIGCRELRGCPTGGPNPPVSEAAQIAEAEYCFRRLGEREPIGRRHRVVSQQLSANVSH